MTVLHQRRRDCVTVCARHEDQVLVFSPPPKHPAGECAGLVSPMSRSEGQGNAPRSGTSADFTIGVVEQRLEHWPAGTRSSKLPGKTLS